MKNQGYLLEFIADNGYDENTYHECSKSERDMIMSSWSSAEVKDRTDCAISWQEYAEHCHNENLFSCL